MTHHVFTYGSLMFPDVWKHLITKPHRSVSACLAGYEAVGIKGEHYPALVPNRTAVTTGRLYFQLNRNELAILDRFEGDEYHRIPVSVKTEEGIQTAYCYVWRNENDDRLTPTPWDAKDFQAQHLSHFIRNYLGG